MREVAPLPTYCQARVDCNDFAAYLVTSYKLQIATCIGHLPAVRAKVSNKGFHLIDVRELSGPAGKQLTIEDGSDDDDRA